MEKKNNNLLDIVPIRTVNWEEDEKGMVTLKKPRFKNILLKKLIQQFHISDNYQVHLDEFGSYVWKQCDGKQCVYDIGIQLRDSYGECVEPVFNRLGLFIKMLFQNCCVIYKSK